LFFKENWVQKLVEVLIRFGERVTKGRWKLSKYKKRAIEAVKTFHGAMKEFSHAPGTLFLSSSFQVASWVLTLSVFFLSFLSIGYVSIDWKALLVIFSIFNIAKSLPIGVPFEVGLPEITLTTLFILVGVPPQESATVTILIRIITLWLRLFIGFLAQQWHGIRTMINH
jgi:uncharacterized protein (TIRG00374 family)